MAVKETRKLAKEEPSDIASEVLDDGYIDVMDDKTVALFPLGDMGPICICKGLED